MGLIQLRDLVAFPDNGINGSDTVINGVHLNKTALEYWNYTLYSNNTLSNNSNCYIIFDNYKPFLLGNGTFINATSCYIPVFGIGSRGKAGIGFAAFFAVSIVFTLLNLRKHGTQYLREDRRFRIIGRRWQWYWMLFVAGCGIISCVASVDIDRDYLQEIAIVLQPFFYFLLTPGIIACVWEATRHWGSWQERQIHDETPFTRHDDRRTTIEFYLPLIFYFWNFLNFFMTVPRSWSNIELQRDPWQTSTFAAPAATDGRFKSGAIFGALAFCTIIYDLSHNLHYYKPRSTGIMGKIDKFCTETPTRLFIAILLLGIFVAYQIASSWIWSISIMNATVFGGWPYGLGYAPVAAIIILFNAFGYIDPNEDLDLIRQRRERGAAADAEIGITRKPHWWKRVNHNAHNKTGEQRLFSEIKNIGGGDATQRHIERGLELQTIASVRASYLQEDTAQYSDHPVNSTSSANSTRKLPEHRAMSVATTASDFTGNNAGMRDRSRSRPGQGGAPYRGSSMLDPFRDSASFRANSIADSSAITFGEPSTAVSDDSDETRGRLVSPSLRPAEMERGSSNISDRSEVSAMTGTTLNTQPQKIRSMLDI